jgi:hypothetical protein
MNVRSFVLTQLGKQRQSTEELSSVLSLDKASRLGKTLATLERQGIIARGEDDKWQRS